MKKYGLTKPEVIALEAITNCQACGYRIAHYAANRECIDGARIAAIDHCHDSGKLRAVLCHTCNTTAGKHGDNALDAWKAGLHDLAVAIYDAPLFEEFGS